MNSLLFIVLALVFMVIGRRIGWIFSRAVLYPSSTGIAAWGCLIWGVGVALCIHGLVVWQHPNLIVKIIFGFLLGVYVAIPNYGLVDESTVPSHGMRRHNMIFTFPVAIYIIALVVIEIPKEVRERRGAEQPLRSQLELAAPLVDIYNPKSPTPNRPQSEMLQELTIIRAVNGIGSHGERVFIPAHATVGLMSRVEDSLFVEYEGSVFQIPADAAR